MGHCQVSDVPGMNPTLLLLLDSSLPCSAMCGSSGTRLSSAVPDLVLNLDVELCVLLPQETVV